MTKACSSPQHLIHEIARVTRCEDVSAPEKITKIEQLLNDHDTLQGDQVEDQLQQSEALLVQQLDPAKYYDALENRSMRLQRRASPILKRLVFDAKASDADSLEAATHFQETDGAVGKVAALAG